MSLSICGNATNKTRMRRNAAFACETREKVDHGPRGGYQPTGSIVIHMKAYTCRGWWASSDRLKPVGGESGFKRGMDEMNRRIYGSFRQ